MTIEETEKLIHPNLDMSLNIYSNIFGKFIDKVADVFEKVNVFLKSVYFKHLRWKKIRKHRRKRKHRI